MDQSAALKAPRLAALAVGTFNVIAGVVVLLTTLEFKSVPLAPKVNETVVTVPTLQLLSALKSYAVPLMVNCLDVGTYPLKADP